MSSDTEGLWKKLGVVNRLIRQSPQQRLGRTAIVKLLYLLQEARGVPLGYDFRLYTFGPFDSDVLNDLETAQCLEALDVRTVIYPSAYGYEVRSGSQAEAVEEAVAQWLDSHEEKIAWAAQTFGGRSASELELIATIVYADRELARRHGTSSLEDLARRVGEVKPKFPPDCILDKCREARDLRILSSVG